MAFVYPLKVRIKLAQFLKVNRQQFAGFILGINPRIISISLETDNLIGRIAKLKRLPIPFWVDCQN